VLGCTERDCPPGDACRIFGSEYGEGWAPSPDGCNTCSCIDGEVALDCTERGCGAIAIQPCSNFSSFESDHYFIDALRVEGDTLSVDASYSGGCVPHDYFRLCYDGFLESFPVQVELRLEHDAQGDACEAIESSTHSFNLRPLADRYAELYGAEHASVILRLGEGATYTF
jgi:hypothetical protein